MRSSRVATVASAPWNPHPPGADSSAELTSPLPLTMGCSSRLASYSTPLSRDHATGVAPGGVVAFLPYSDSSPAGKCPSKKSAPSAGASVLSGTPVGAGSASQRAAACASIVSDGASVLAYVNFRFLIDVDMPSVMSAYLRPERVRD